MTADAILAQSGASRIRRRRRRRIGHGRSCAPRPSTPASTSGSSGVDARARSADAPPAELAGRALGAGVERYKRREATFGLTGYVDLQGAAIRVARDYLEAIAPIIARYATVGIA